MLGLWVVLLAGFRRLLQMVIGIVSDDGDALGFDFGHGVSGERIDACGCFVDLCLCLGDFDRRIAWMMSQPKNLLSVLLFPHGLSYRRLLHTCEIDGVCAHVCGRARCRSLSYLESGVGGGDGAENDGVMASVIGIQSCGGKVMRCEFGSVSDSSTATTFM